MTTAAAPAGDSLRRWVSCGALVLGLHAAGAALLVRWHDPVAIGEPSSAIVVDLAPFATPPSDSVEDIAPGPKQQEIDAPPPEPAKAEKNDDEKIVLLPAPTPSVAALPPPEPVDRPAPPPLPPVPTTTAPPVAHASPAEVNSWYSGIMQRIERHKGYPPAARMRREQGVVTLSFSIDRQGHLLSSRVSHGSGFAALDREALATIERAQPFPPPPAAMPEAAFNFDVPVHFGLR